MGNTANINPSKKHRPGSNEPIPYIIDRKPLPENEGGPYGAYAAAGQQEDAIQLVMVPTVFQWGGGGKLVYVGGTFSEWKALPMVKLHGSFVTIVNIPEGDHQYKFLVDGEWKHDPKLKCVVSGKGIMNNLATVRQTDFGVFQALVNDSKDTYEVESKERSQEIPTATPWHEDQLLQDPLNQDTLLSFEPTLLPGPNNVMLNHLYVTSIENDVTVLSTTHLEM